MSNTHNSDLKFHSISSHAKVASALLAGEVFEWVNGVEWKCNAHLQIGQLVTHSVSSWLPSDWPLSAPFVGWNRWGQPVVHQHGNASIRYVRRGMRQWQPIQVNDSLHVDGLWLNNTPDVQSTVEGWHKLGWWDKATSEQWLRHLGWDSTVPQGPTETRNQEKEGLDQVGQVPYEAMSQQPHAAFVPGGLAHETKLALQKWSKRHHQTCDEWVTEKTGLSLDVFAGEQVDVIALAIDEIQAGRDFLLGDQTGMGKGRVLAALALWAHKQGLLPVFFTERPALFHDFWRDLEDVGGDANPFANAYILHQNAKLTWPNGDVWKSPLTAKEKAALLETPKQVIQNLVLTTYSQFNRKDEKKIQWMQELSKRAVFFFDEAHNATGQSNIRESIQLIKKACPNGIVFASATFGKDEEHVGFYSSLLGESPIIHDWAYWLGRRGAEPLRVAVSKRLVQAGRMVRREQDLSGLLHTLKKLPEEKREALERESDVFARFNANLYSLQKAAQRFPIAAGQKVDPARLFGGLIYRLNRLALMMLSLDFVESSMAEAIQKGIKPIAVCESTLEQVLGEAEETEIEQSWHSLADVLIFEVKSFLDRWEVPRSGQLAQGFGVQKAQMLEWIEKAFAHYPPSPLDALRERLARKGISIGEVSGRAQRFVPKENVWVPEKVAGDRVQQVRDFNAGTLDGLIVTRAGCAGISLHASKKFTDRRPRELIEWQIPRNVAERVQFFGRVYRKDQVVPSSVSTIFLGLPSERRNHAIQFSKMQALYQFTKGQDATELMSVPNYLEHPQADTWALEWLLAYPGYAAALGIQADPQKSTPWMDRIFSRLPLLSVQQQRIVLSFWDELASKLLDKQNEEKKIHQMEAVPVLPGWKVSLVGGLTSITPRPKESGLPKEWSVSMNEFAEKTPFARTFFKQMAALACGQTIRWYDTSLRRVVVGRVIGAWIPKEPFHLFWKGSAVRVWSPMLEQDLWIPLLSLYQNKAFQISEKSFNLEASDVAHQEMHRVRWGLKGDMERLVLWQGHHHIGEWKDGSDVLWLPSGFPPEQLEQMSVPLGQPFWVFSFGKMRADEEAVVAYDKRGGRMTWMQTSHGQYVFRCDVDAEVEDGTLVNATVRAKYGSPKQDGSGRYALVLDVKAGRSFLFHLLGRGVIFGCQADMLPVLVSFEKRFEEGK
jgi:hypothetical protein